MTLFDCARFIDPHQEAIPDDEVKKAVRELQIMRVHFFDKNPVRSVRSMNSGSCRIQSRFRNIDAPYPVSLSAQRDRILSEAAPQIQNF